jgi:hypothetical protein
MGGSAGSPMHSTHTDIFGLIQNNPAYDANTIRPSWVKAKDEAQGTGEGKPECSQSPVMRSGD